MKQTTLNQKTGGGQFYRTADGKVLWMLTEEGRKVAEVLRWVASRANRHSPLMVTLACHAQLGIYSAAFALAGALQGGNSTQAVLGRRLDRLLA
jgi:cell division FtsZ-interacting protein ZapD